MKNALLQSRVWVVMVVMAGALVSAKSSAQDRVIHGRSGITYTNLSPSTVSPDQFLILQRQIEAESNLLSETLVRKIGISASRSREITYHQIIISSESTPESIRTFLSDYSSRFMQVRNEIIDLSRESYGASLGCDPALNLKKCSKALASLRTAFDLAAKRGAGSGMLKEGIYFVPEDKASSELRFEAKMIRFDAGAEELLQFIE